MNVCYIYVVLCSYICRLNCNCMGYIHSPYIQGIHIDVVTVSIIYSCVLTFPLIHLIKQKRSCVFQSHEYIKYNTTRVMPYQLSCHMLPKYVLRAFQRPQRTTNHSLPVDCVPGLLPVFERISKPPSDQTQSLSTHTRGTPCTARCVIHVRALFPEARCGLKAAGKTQDGNASEQICALCSGPFQ